MNSSYEQQVKIMLAQLSHWPSSRWLAGHSELFASIRREGGKREVIREQHVMSN